jgi:hypothetical protein
MQSTKLIYIYIYVAAADPTFLFQACLYENMYICMYMHHFMRKICSLPSFPFCHLLWAFWSRYPSFLTHSEAGTFFRQRFKKREKKTFEKRFCATFIRQYMYMESGGLQPQKKGPRLYAPALQIKFVVLKKVIF